MFGKISTGALSDLEKITKQAYAMVSIYGLSEVIGNVSYYDSSGQSDYSLSKPYSDKTAELIDEEVNKLISVQYERTLKILRDNKDLLVQLADKLLEKEVIFRDDLEAIFGKSEFEAELKEEKKVSKRESLVEVNNEDSKTEAKEAALTESVNKEGNVAPEDSTTETEEKIELSKDDVDKTND